MGEEQRLTPPGTWVLLVAGMVVGLAVALWGLSKPPTAPAPHDAVAIVDGAPIPGEVYAAALAALDNDTRARLTDTDRRRVLERLVDEELLVQHALRLGMARQSTGVRGALVDAVLDLGRAQAGSRMVDESEARRFLETHAPYFRRGGQRHVRAWRCPTVECARTSARELATGKPPGAPAIELPDGLIPERAIAQYLGEALAAVARAMPAGEIRTVERHPAGPTVLQVLQVVAGEAPAFDDVRDAVVAEIRRRESEAGLRALLESLRAQAKIEYPGAP